MKWLLELTDSVLSCVLVSLISVSVLQLVLLVSNEGLVSVTSIVDKIIVNWCDTTLITFAACITHSPTWLSHALASHGNALWWAAICASSASFDAKTPYASATSCAQATSWHILLVLCLRLAKMCSIFHLLGWLISGRTRSCQPFLPPTTECKSS